MAPGPLWTVARPAGTPDAEVLGALAVLLRRYTGVEPALRRAGSEVLAPLPPYGEVRVGLGTALTLGSDTVPEGVLGWLAEDLPVVLATGELAEPAAERRPAPLPDDPRFPASALDSSIPARFAAIAAAHPDRPAVLADDGTLTYAELAARAAAVAAAVPSGGRVGLVLDPGTDVVAAILGVLTAGSAYVPLDPGFPLARLAATAADADLGAVLASPDHRDLAARLAPGVPVLDPAAVGPSTGDEATPVVPVSSTVDVGPDDAAYLLYTSGSTGRPKGVRQNHRGVLFQARNHALAHGVGAADRVGVVTSFGFDASVTDLFTALLTGAAAVPVDVRRHGVGHLLTALRERRVSVYHSPPTLFRYLVGSLGPGEVLGDVRVVLLGGEELTRRDVEAHRRHFPAGSLLVNGYGATEVSFALQERRTTDTPLDGGVVPIGRPLDGLDVLLTGPAGPACLAGEIVVRGRAVAAGYRNRPDDRFTDLGGGVREYRTGDLGRRLPDGRIVFAGRGDRQVKVRGHRVELGEVEAVLAGLPGVALAVVTARSERAGGTLEVLAHVTGTAPDPAALDPGTLRAALAERLPPYAVPRAVVVLDAMPLTPTGKVDARALPDPPRAEASTVDDPTEALVAAAWCAVLGVAAVGRDETFFDAGGHSLLLARLQQRLERDLGRTVPLHRLLEHPTVRSFSRWLGGATTDLGDVRARMARRRVRAGR